MAFVVVAPTSIFATNGNLDFDDQPHFSEKWSNKINVNAVPRAGRRWPTFVTLRRRVGVLTADLARHAEFLDVRITAYQAY